MRPEEQITEPLTELHQNGSAQAVLASRRAMRQGQLPNPLADTPTTATMTCKSGFAADCIIHTRRRGNVTETIEVKRSGTQSVPSGAHHPLLKHILANRPTNNLDPDAALWWATVDKYRNGFGIYPPLTPGAMKSHTFDDCDDLGCASWNHNKLRKHQGGWVAVGIAQPPAYLFATKYLERLQLCSQPYTVLVVLGGDGRSGWGQPVADYYSPEGCMDTTLVDFGPALNRSVITPHGEYLRRLLNDPNASTFTTQDRELIRNVVNAMW